MPARFGAADRLRKQAEFDRVYRARAFAADDVLIVNGCTSGLAHSRLGLSIGAVVGNAVTRNRWKRIIREAFRLSRQQIPVGLDLVVRPQKGAKPVFEAVCRSLPALAARIARRIEKHNPNPKATDAS